MVTIRKLDAEDLAQNLGTWSSGSGPLYIQLALALDLLIRRGHLRNGSVLPSERKLADALYVSRSTVVSAYDRLEDGKRVESRQGSGTRVTVKEVPGVDDRNPRVSRFFVPADGSTALVQASPTCSLDLASELKELAGNIKTIPKGVVMGLPELRRSLADRYTRKGMDTTSEQIMITSGAQQAVSLVASGLLKSGDVAVTEEPTWPGAVDAIERVGARVCGVSIDAGGIDIDELRDVVDRLRPGLLVVNPHHQNPTTTRLVPHRRRVLAELSAEYNLPMIEDRVLADLAYDGNVPPPLASLVPDAPIITVESLSKTIWHGIGVGWIRASPSLIGRLKLEKAMSDLGTSLMPQLLACQLEPRLDTLIDERSKTLAVRAQMASKMMCDVMPDWSFETPKGGSSLWCKLPGPVAASFARHAARYGLVLVTGKAFSIQRYDNQHIRVPYTSEPAEFIQAIEILADSWASFDPVNGIFHDLGSDGDRIENKQAELLHRF